MKKLYIILPILILLIQTSIYSEELIQKWEIIAEFGMIKTLYVSKDGLKDKFFVAQILHAVMQKHDKRKPIQIMMFDNKSFVPKGFPMSDQQMLHLKAQYNRNPNANFEKFVWITVINSKTSPPELKHTEAKIQPGYAE